jgi:hypothetical protein
MHRFVPSEADARIREFLASGAAADLDEDDCYTLLTFARRSVLGVMRGEEEASLDEARAALAAVDEEKIDFRDVVVTGQLVDWAAAPRSASGAGMWIPIETPDGPALAMDTVFDYRPGRALVAIAFRMQDALEEDRYRVTGLTASEGVPDVWLSGDAADEVRQLGGLTVEARLLPEAHPRADDQQMSVFLVQAASEEDAGRLAYAAVSRDWFQTLGLAHGRIACVTVARSFVEGTPAFEGAGALERFRDPFTRALTAPPPPAGGG